MKIYKDKQFLVFDFENGKTVKYDFAKKRCIGISGKEVKGLNSQLSGLTIDDLCNNCVDKQYGKFLKFVQMHGNGYGRDIYNIGTILNRVPRYSKFEQIFSAGFEGVYDDDYFRYSINDIPKSLIKLAKEHSITLSNKIVRSFQEDPDACFLAYNLDYVSLDDKDIYKMLTSDGWCTSSYFNRLIKNFGYQAKPLLLYIDRLKTFEAIENMSDLMKEIYDYVQMMAKISPKYDRYPNHFLTTHKIACRNYNRLAHQFMEDDFKSRIDIGMEKTFGEYCFIYPKCTQDIKDEAVQQNNCVASYIQRVIDGKCHILFLRKKNNIDKSLVTIEVRDGKIVQALRHFNHPLNNEESMIVDKWNNWYANKMKENEGEELKNVG